MCRLNVWPRVFGTGAVQEMGYRAVEGAAQSSATSNEGLEKGDPCHCTSHLTSNHSSSSYKSVASFPFLR